MSATNRYLIQIMVLLVIPLAACEQKLAFVPEVANLKTSLSTEILDDNSAMSSEVGNTLMPVTSVGDGDAQLFNDTEAPILGETPVVTAPSPVSPIPVIPIEIPKVFNVSLQDTGKFICEPFGNTASTSAGGGIKASLTYVDSKTNLSVNQRNAFLATDYFSGSKNFIASTTPIFLSQIFTPTQSFDQGFKTSTNTFLSNGSGEKLIEYFGLKLETELVLSANDKAGYYELASIADDGVKVYTGAEGHQELLINNDGAHAVRMGCTAKAIYMDKQSKLPMTLYYNQGPRYHIANVLAWRYLGNTSYIAKNKLCGAVSSTDFWDNGKEKSYWTQLKADGYKVLDVGNYQLADQQINPCSKETVNVLKAAAFTEISQAKTVLKVELVSEGQIEARIYRIVNGARTLIGDLGSCDTTKNLALNLPKLEASAEYSVELKVKQTGKNTIITNEVKFNTSLD